MVKVSTEKVFQSISRTSTVRYKKTGHVSEILWMSTKSKGSQIKKLSKENYMLLKTGEVFDFTHIENRSDDLKSVARSLSQGRDMINANVTEIKNCRWLTLTYGENMRDGKRLWIEFKQFVRDTRKKYGRFEYVAAAEPQGRGAWHLHVLLIFDHKAPFMANEDISEIWANGFVTIKKIDDVDNVGAYLTAYLGDVALEDYDGNKEGAKGLKIAVVNGENKKFVKGGRLHMYPPGFHIFRWSRGVRRPEIERTTYEQAKEKVGADTPTYQVTKTLTDEKSGFTSVLSREFYNSKRFGSCQTRDAISEDEPPAAAMSSSEASTVDCRGMKSR